MNARMFLVLAVFATVKGDDIYQPPPARYSFHVPPAPVGYSTHSLGYASHPIGFTGHPVGFTGHPVGYITSNHQAPIAVYTMPHINGPYQTPGHQLSFVHGPYLAAGPTVISTPPHSITTYSVREPELPPCRSHIPLSTPSNSNMPTNSPQKTPPQVATPTPPPPTGTNTHYKIPNPLSLLSSFAPPSVNAYHSTNSKDHPPSSQNVFSIGISTPKFDDGPYGH